MVILSGPSLTQTVNDYHVLWFEQSNTYIITESTHFELISLFTASKDFDAFSYKLLQKGYESSHIERVYNDIQAFLHDCNMPPFEDVSISRTFSVIENAIPTFYTIEDVNFQVNYGSEALKSIIHPQIEHLECAPIKNSTTTTIFDMYIEKDSILFFKNQQLIKAYPTKEYHVLQGKFAMEVLCMLNQNTENDWLGTFHASTVAKHNKGIMLIGDSGSGKSTFTALAMHDGYELIADDITPILKTNLKVCSYPAAVSIKSGAFEVLENSIPNFKNLTSHYINPYKGYVKYVAPQTFTYKQRVSCKTMVLIHYNATKDTKLEQLKAIEALNILIPESWINPSKDAAHQFLNWLETISFYKLTYSNFSEAKALFSELFKDNN